MSTVVFLNGDYCPANDAKISIFDRGILFGDSIYEVIPVYKSKPFFLDLHLDRLESNLKKLKINKPSYDWVATLDQLIQLNGGGNLQLYVQITRGNPGIRKHDIPYDIKPTCFAFTLHNPFPTIENKHQGLHAKLVEDLRWLRCDIKTTSLLGNILLHEEALSAGADVALLTRHGFLTEGSATNFFIVDKQGVIKTPPLSNLCLPGITRHITIELIRQLKLPFIEEPISVQSLFNAKEVWITSTTKEIFPIASIDGIPVGRNDGSSYWEQLNHAYQLLIKRL
ncbi:D-alanine transaminase [Legionella beliardensis]|uniref:Aminodeoxychorismate lyase n=1 Tax=Legionella beliardensis TaxID=91822 RepID=A0A378I1P2_9GAMM|nr:D-amino acid aminotransferase [Legionella beliardensis]STX29089.1 D-alanine transaminase [Legionella beliardensis]